MYFKATAGEILIDSIWSDPRNRHDKREEDHNLYFDSATMRFFVVENVSSVSGPNVSVDHRKREIEEYVAEHPELREHISALVVQRLKMSH